MTDYFAILDEPHRPWLDPEALKKKFLALSAEVHPDRVHAASDCDKLSAQKCYTDINQAYNQLRRPKERLQHLLELETGTKPLQVQQVPNGLMEFFVQVGNLFKETDAFLIEQSRTSSPLLHVQFFETGQGWTDKLKALRGQLELQQQELLTELKAVDDRWIGQRKSDPVARATMLRRIEELSRLFSYFARWEEQIQERILRLSL